MTTTILWYRFRIVDRITKKWYTARYRAEYPVLTRRYEQLETIGRAEVRHVPDDWPH